MCSGHFWKLWCWKSARCCGAKHISKSKCTKHVSLRPLLEVEMSKKCTPSGAKHISKSKVQKTEGWGTFGLADVVFRGRRKGLCTLSKSSKKREGFCSSFICNHHYTTLLSTPLQTTLQQQQQKQQRQQQQQQQQQQHYTTLHYTPLHCTALHCTALHTLHDTPLHFTTHNYTTLHYTTLHCTALHCTTLHCTTLHYTTLHYTPLHTTTLITLHYATLLYTTLHLRLQLQLRCTTLITLHYTTQITHYTQELQLHYSCNYNYSCTTPHYIQQLWTDQVTTKKPAPAAPSTSEFAVRSLRKISKNCSMKSPWNHDFCCLNSDI